MAHGEYGWAYELLVKGFEQRIHEYLTEERIRRKIREQAQCGDELYEAMLGTAAGRKHFISMMTYWSVGQGIAVSLRHWVEDLIAELVVNANRKVAFGKPIACAFTLKDLKRYAYITNPDAIATAGENETEHSQNRTWDVQMRSELVERANVVTKNLVQCHRSRKFVSEDGERWLRAGVQEQELFEAAVNVRSDGYVKQRLICNLLVLEQPPTGKIYGFRFASPRLSAERDLADEKRNLLLLYGWIRQEKPFRLKSDAVEVKWAHLFSRPISPAQLWYFHQNEVMQSSDFWEFVGVPYEVVGYALKAAGDSLGKHTGKLLRKMAFTRVVRELEVEQRELYLADIL